MNENLSHMLRNNALISSETMGRDISCIDNNTFSASQQMMQVINSQNILIMKLLQKQQALYHELSTKFNSSDSGSAGVQQRNPQNKVSGYTQFRRQDRFSDSSSQQEKPRNITNSVKILQWGGKPLKPQVIEWNKQFESSPEQAPINDLKQEKHGERKKQAQTKNMIKNFGKAIFGYIYKNREARQRVLKFLEIEEQAFMKMLNKLKGHIHSISELRTLWIQQGNQYHRAFRILSSQYLRKHCLERTFNSRVQNYFIHLKYRERLLQGLMNPEDFTALKIN